MVDVDDSHDGLKRYRWRSAIRPPTGLLTVFLLAAAAMISILGWMNTDPRTEEARTNLMALSIVALIALVVSVWRVIGQGLEVTRTGIVIRNFTRTHRLRWSDIFEIRPTVGKMRNSDGRIVAPLIDVEVLAQSSRGGPIERRIDCLTARTVPRMYRRPAMAVLLDRAPAHVRRYRIGDDGKPIKDSPDNRSL